ncbi:phospholipase A2 inhibitor and Ly6/PLAUR domain-containing protein-like [Pleurodeles waltl]|uniref:phospholipase A2 inhibitor and Ly6/PLAUR domain-containing protein-like n=1 Tax=Pleurodeles waltl TaxID=8319 RepID=UPI00370994EC
MRALLASVSILLAFIATGETLNCELCMNLNGTTCSGEKTACDANVTHCDNTFVEIEYNGQTSFMAFKTCAAHEKCNSYVFSQSIGGFKFRIKKDHCDKDNCNLEIITLPPRNSTPNGVRCPLCYAQNTTTCQTNETMECTGRETKCLDFGGKIRRYDQIVKIASKNCVNEQPCNEPTLNCPHGPVVEVEHFRCSDGVKHS